ncbi:MAG: 1-acyl-sn-glycerol-3-phosphate acyltransferase [Isosphaeraceae bacterium]
MAAHQIFAGHAGIPRWLLPRLGIFPVDREGSDPAAVKTATELLASAEHLLLVFPEGEVYYLADRLTPLREGVAFLAHRACKALADRGKKAWVVPVGIKYRFVDHHDPVPSFRERMAQLERRILWWPRHDRPLVERIARYAEASLALKELEYLGGAQAGPLRDRIVALRGRILDEVAGRRAGKPVAGSDPERIKELRRRCLEALAQAPIAEADKAAIRRDLNDLYVAVQTLSYPGDYVFAAPTLERVAETLMKLDEDVLMASTGNPAVPLGPRKAVVRVGEPIDVAAVAAQARRSREALAAVTSELERRIQGLLDGLGPGRPIPEPAAVQAEPAQASSSGS